MGGKVTLVGAGPYDFGLLTIKGEKALKNADVVIYDRLIGNEILSLIPENAEKINAGKKSSHHLIPQCEINKIIVKKALEGKNVVRLKGGDNFLFGRGAEELETVIENEIDFEVVPGVTSALAVPCYAGIPATHRDFVSSVHIITGHLKKGKKLDIDFKSLVKLDGTLIFLMGLSSLNYIVQGLIDAGMDKFMPCAVIEKGTSPFQRKVVSTLSDIFANCQNEKIESPAIIVVGKVCSLAEKLDWFSKKPLKSKNIVVTRPKERIGKISEKIRNLGGNVIEYQCIKTISLIDEKMIDIIVKKFQNYNWVVFTSPAGVCSVFEKLKEYRIDGRALCGCKIGVIGKGTEEELAKFGLFADFVPQKYDCKALGAGLSEKISMNEKVLILRAEKGSPDLIFEFDKNNIVYEDFPVYRTEVVENFDISEKINSGQIDFVTFTSSSIVRAFMENSANIDVSKFVGVCIGEKTADMAKKYNINYVVSEKADIDSFVEKLIEVVDK